MTRVTHTRTLRSGTVVASGAAMGLGGNPSDLVLFDGDTAATLVPRSSLKEQS